MSDIPIRILLIEDDPEDADLLQEILGESSNHSFMLEWVDRLQTGLERLSQGGIDMVLTDLSLPDSQGVETFTRIYAHAPTMPIVVLSGLDDETVAVKAVHEGAQDYLVKGEMNNNLLVRALRYAMERQRVQEALRESEERYALAARGANDGLWDWDLITNEMYYSPRWKTMLGYGEQNEIGHSPNEWFDRVHPDDLMLLQRDLEAHLAGLTSHFKFEHRILHKDGAYRWVLCRGLAVYDSEGKAYRMAGSQTDSTRRKEAEERLRYEALHDSLTGLPNRSLFIERLEKAFARAKQRQGYLFAVLFLDLDRFKIINDSQGHMIGDQLLMAVARRLQTCLRPNDTLARFGGDEFVILLDDLRDTDEVQRVADRVLGRLTLPFDLKGTETFTSVSIGITVHNANYERPEELLRDADTAMYQAKATGKARYELFDTDQHARVAARWRLETALRQAVERQEFEVYYQPIISLFSGRIEGVEALLRWRHPQRGLLAPDEFISLAEETGLIIPIGEWLLHTACTQTRHWQTAGFTPLRVAVNVGPAQFRDQDLAMLVEEALARSGLSPQSLELEIVESIPMKHSDLEITTLRRLRAMGVQISIDDFGLGSSLDCLKYIPLNTLKIDQSFVGGMLENEDDAAIISAIIAMAHRLDLKVIAEGVETEQQLAFLLSQRSDEVQGFLFSQPVPAAELTRLLQVGDLNLLQLHNRSSAFEQIIHSQAMRDIGYALVDENLTVLTASATMHQWLGGTPNELVDRYLPDLFPELVGIEPVLNQMLPDKSDPVTIPKIYRQLYRSSAGGSERYFDLRVEPFRAAGATLLVIMTDVTEQAYLEFALRQERNELRLKMNRQESRANDV